MLELVIYLMKFLFMNHKLFWWYAIVISGGLRTKFCACKTRAAQLSELFTAGSGDTWIHHWHSTHWTLKFAREFFEPCIGIQIPTHSQSISLRALIREAAMYGVRICYDNAQKWNFVLNSLNNQMKREIMNQSAHHSVEAAYRYSIPNIFVFNWFMPH